MADTATTNDYDYTPPKGSGNFFALADGETARIRIQSRAYAYEDTFKKDGQPDKISTRYAWLIYNHTEKKAQVLKQSGTFFESLKVITKDPDFGKDPTTYDIKVTRVGTGTDTKYPLQGAKTNLDLTPEMMAEVADLDIVKDSNEATIIPLADYIANGLKFNTATTASGDVIIKSLDEDAKTDID